MKKIISFEGIDGCGKTTQINLISKSNSNYNLMLLNIERFPKDDLNALISNSKTSIFEFPSKFQDQLFNISEGRIYMIYKFLFSKNKNIFFIPSEYHKESIYDMTYRDPSNYGKKYN